MSLEKAISSGKEKRKPYYGAGRVDTTCRNHGSCPYCRSNRTHKHRRAVEGVAARLREHSVAEDQERQDREDALLEALFADLKAENDLNEFLMPNELYSESELEALREHYRWVSEVLTTEERLSLVAVVKALPRSKQEQLSTCMPRVHWLSTLAARALAEESKKSS